MHNGYASDSSRTVAYGEPSAKEKEIYELAKEMKVTFYEAKVFQDLKQRGKI